MEWVSILVSAVISTTISVVLGFVIKKLLSKGFRQHEDYIKLKEEEKNAEQNKQIMSIVQQETKPIFDKVKEIDDSLLKVSNGTLSSLRNDILTCYYRCREKGYRNDYDYQNIHDLYAAYDSLKGNSFISDIMNRFDNLPVKEDVKNIDTHIGKITLNE